MNIGELKVRLVLSACCALAWQPLWAQQPQQVAAQRGGLEEIIVTARKREESVLDVPVTQTVLTAMTLENHQVVEFADLPKLVPGLMTGRTMLTNGSLLSIRGVGTTTQDQGVDSTVLINLDGLSVANGLAFQSGMFDLAQIEVLKGPQALFFGKSSPGGVVSMRTADPGDHFEAIGSFGYEHEARGYRGELILSGPVSDTLGVRLAAMYSEGDGYFRNVAVPAPFTGAAAPPSSREPETENYIIRGTALWQPTENLSARLKINYVHDYVSGSGLGQFANCPGGTDPVPGLPDFIGGGEDCRLDDTLRVVSYDPAAFPGIMNKGHPFMETDQFFVTAEVNYDLTPALTLTSVTGWYDLTADSLANTLSSTHAAPPLSAENPNYTREDFTQEFRLNSDFSSPLNFTLGAFYQDGELSPRVRFFANRAMMPEAFWPFVDLDVRNTISVETLSIFGQLRWNFAPQWELAVGARYTDETRKQDPVDLIAGVAKPMVVSKISDDDFSPEVTLTYQPSDTMTLFAAYKEGFKSGSFSTSTPTAAVLDNAFDSEGVEGGELGLKSVLMDNQVRFNASAYYYEYDGLQVGAIQPERGTVGVKTLNAGGARVFGVELDALYAPEAMPGLTINAALNWNRGRYSHLPNVPCWPGQLIAEGCDRVFVPATGLYTAQDLSGRQMVRAPEWQGNFGFTYELPIANGYTLAFSNSNSFTDDYPTDLGINRPGNDNIASAFWKVDLSVALRSPDDRYEIALIGKNVADKVTAGFCSTANYKTGVGVFPGTISGGTERGPAGIEAIQCAADPGREIWLRFTYRLGS